MYEDWAGMKSKLNSKGETREQELEGKDWRARTGGNEARPDAERGKARGGATLMRSGRGRRVTTIGMRGHAKQGKRGRGYW
jgi:hypothetical protein